MAEVTVVDDIRIMPIGQTASRTFYRPDNATYEGRSQPVVDSLRPLRLPRTLANAAVDGLQTLALGSAAHTGATPSTNTRSSNNDPGANTGVASVSVAELKQNTEKRLSNGRESGVRHQPIFLTRYQR